jgi:very-short-patch-repair endonuclease
VCDSGVVVELDGAQHLADAAAYRRDRRKDLLLQENGYRVLRFLAEDVGKELTRFSTLFPRSRACFCNGSAIRLPNPPRGSVS